MGFIEEFEEGGNHEDTIKAPNAYIPSQEVDADLTCRVLTATIFKDENKNSDTFGEEKCRIQFEVVKDNLPEGSKLYQKRVVEAKEGQEVTMYLSMSKAGKVAAVKYRFIDLVNALGGISGIHPDDLKRGGEYGPSKIREIVSDDGAMVKGNLVRVYTVKSRNEPYRDTKIELLEFAPTAKPKKAKK